MEYWKVPFGLLSVAILIGITLYWYGRTSNQHSVAPVFKDESDPSSRVVEDTLPTSTTHMTIDTTGWEGETELMYLGSMPVMASIARTEAERQQGLSDTAMLPARVVKLFVFPTTNKHGFWMKDMRYSIDIAWVDETLTIVHLEPNVSPSTYPKIFSPTTNARYVIETSAGFFAKEGIGLGDSVRLPGSVVIEN